MISSEIISHAGSEEWLIIRTVFPHFQCSPKVVTYSNSRELTLLLALSWLHLFTSLPAFHQVPRPRPCVFQHCHILAGTSESSNRHQKIHPTRILASCLIASTPPLFHLRLPPLLSLIAVPSPPSRRSRRLRISFGELSPGISADSFFPSTCRPRRVHEQYRPSTVDHACPLRTPPRRPGNQSAMESATMGPSLRTQSLPSSRIHRPPKLPSLNVS